MIKKKDKITVSVIYVFHSGIQNLIDSITSIYESSPKVNFEIIVVNNNKKDISKVLKQKFKNIKLIKSKKNLGYGGGNNLGATEAKGKYLFILNPDTKVKKQAIDELVNFLHKNSSAGVVAPNLIDEKGHYFKKMGSRKLTPLQAVFSLSIIDRLWSGNPISNNFYLKDKSKQQKREVNAVPGSAFLIRKDLFDKIQGFDENFFLYFEEHDLGNRIQESDFKSYIIPEAEVIHKNDGTNQNSNRLKKYYLKSRNYYFEKHFGKLNALMVDFLLNIGKFEILFLIILTLASFLRLYKISYFDSYYGEIGDNLLDIKNLYLNKEIPLIGPPTSHPWLHFGPIFYWIYGPILILSGFNPISHAYFGAFISIMTVIFNYYFVSKLINKFVAILSTFIISISPFYLHLGREGRFFTIVLLLVYPYVYLLFRHLKFKRFGLFSAGLILGLMLNFHFTPILLVPPTLVLSFIYKRNRFLKNSLNFFLGIALANIPLIIYDAKNNFQMLIMFLMWFPYRVAGFLGLYPKNTLNEPTLKNNLLSLYEFVSTTFTVNNTRLAIIVFLIFLSSILFILIELSKNKLKNPIYTVLISFLLFGYIGIFVHGNPPNHYYMPLLFIPPLTVSILIQRLGNKILQKLLFIIFLTSLFLNNLNYYFSENFYYRDRGKVQENGSVPYQLKVDVANTILNDSSGRFYSIKRQGLNDQFEGDFAQDYQYLLWWFGNEPVLVGEIIIDQQPPETEYYIFELDEKSISMDRNQQYINVIYRSSGLIVTKKDLDK